MVTRISDYRGPCAGEEVLALTSLRWETGCIASRRANAADALACWKPTRLRSAGGRPDAAGDHWSLAARHIIAKRFSRCAGAGGVGPRRPGIRAADHEGQRFRVRLKASPSNTLIEAVRTVLAGSVFARCRYRQRYRRWMQPQPAGETKFPLPEHPAYCRPGAGARTGGSRQSRIGILPVSRPVGRTVKVWAILRRSGLPVGLRPC